MISIIVSSVLPERYSLFVNSINGTIGNVPYELLVHDNRETKWSLCKLYNHYAAKSQYPILCFFHEDILFHTIDWGERLLHFFDETPQAGVIGFAGATLKTKTLSGWGTYAPTSRKYLLQHLSRTKKREVSANPEQEAFSPVVVLDGLALIVPKKVWQEHPFDEELYTGFHLYDLDFSMQVAQKYTNYVCHTILVEHLSNGSYSKAWYVESLKFHKKWEKKLPYSVVCYSPEFISRCEDFSAYLLAKGELRHAWTEQSVRSILSNQIRLKSNAQKMYALKIVKHVLTVTGKRMMKGLKISKVK